MKRFTDTGKFDDRWYSELSMVFKLAWDYLLAKCDSAGIWEPNMKLADFQIGGKVNWKEFLEACGGRVAELPNGKWWVASFVKFQYGRLSRDAKVHISVIRSLEKNGIEVDSDGMPIPLGWVKDKDKEQEQDKEQEGEGMQGERDFPALEIYAAYPKKTGKQEALKRIKTALKTIPHPRLLERTIAYADAVGRWPPSEQKFIPDPERWFGKGRWDDDPQTWVYHGNSTANGGLDKSKTIGLRPEEMPLVICP